MPSSLEHAATHPATVLSELAFQRLYEANSTNIHSYLLAVSNRRDVADDLLQETFCRLLLHPKSTAHLNPLELRRYLFRIATNLLRDRYRSGDTAPFNDPPEPSATGLHRLSVRTLLFRARNKAKQFLAPAGGSR